MGQQINFTWSTINLGTYAAIDALSRANASDPMQKDVSLLSMITGKSENYFMALPLTELAKVRQEMHDFLKAGIEEKYYSIFKCNGRKYKVSESMEEFNGAQLEGISALQLTDENFASKSHYAMAILCKEVKTWKFWQKELSVKQRAEDFENHLPTSIGMGIVNFFFLYSQHLYPLVLEKVKKETLILKQKLKTNGQSRTLGKRK